MLAGPVLSRKVPAMEQPESHEAAATADGVNRRSLLAGVGGLLAAGRTRLGIPLIFGLDVIHGYTTNFPIPLAQGASFDPGVAAADATVAAKEARRSGIHWTYAPMMDVTHEPRWGRIAEGYGED